MTTELEAWKARALAAESLIASARDDAADDLSVIEEARSRAASAEEAAADHRVRLEEERTLRIRAEEALARAREDLSAAFAACSKAGVVFDDLARHDLPYAIGRLASDLSAECAKREEAERELTGIDLAINDARGCPRHQKIRDLQSDRRIRANERDAAIARAEAAEARAKVLGEVLRLARDAMNYMGDILNGMDAVEPEDEKKTVPAFAAVRIALGEPLLGDAERIVALPEALRSLLSSSGETAATTTKESA